jgi:hypothetical protein
MGRVLKLQLLRDALRAARGSALFCGGLRSLFVPIPVYGWLPYRAFQK